MPSRTRLRVRPWAVAAVAASAGCGFLVALEVAARRHGLPGPLTNQVREVVFAPKSGPLLYAGMALVGRLVRAGGPVCTHLLDWVYIQLAVAAVLVALYQLRHVAAERRFPRHHVVRTFLAIGLLGPGIYMIFPVVGPVFAYGSGAFGTGGGHWAPADLWPDTPPPLTTPQPMPYDAVTPRNCMPSLHTAWATAIFIHSRKGPRFLRFAGTFWLAATLTATLGFGYHYGVDLVAGVVFALTVEAALRASAHGWDRSGIRLVAHGATVFAALLASYRYLSTEMAQQPWLSGPLVLLAMVSVINAYLRTTRRWDASPAPEREPSAQAQAQAQVPERQLEAV